MSRQGHLKGRTGGNSAQRRGPLRKIVEVLTVSNSIFDRPRVRLECGHTTCSNGQYAARCSDPACMDQVDPLAFPCPHCKADPGLHCQNEFGRETAGFCTARIRRAKKP